MRRTLHLAHQFDAGLHDWLRRFLPEGTRVDRLPADDPWNGAEDVEVLLVANGKLRHLARIRPRWTRNLAWVHLRPTGLDDAPAWLFDVPHLTVSRGASAPAIAEYVLAAMLDFEKRLHDLRVTQHSGWSGRESGSLEGRTLGLLGFGEIGRAVAERARAFGMVIHTTTRTMGATTERPIPGVSLLPFPELCAQSDHLVLCAPLTEKTRDLFDAAAFAHCRQGQHLVNVARGGLIVQDALRQALDARLARATLDVWNVEPPPPGHWVYSHPRVVLTPHCAARAASTGQRTQAILEANLTCWLQGQPKSMIGQVNRSTRY